MKRAKLDENEFKNLEEDDADVRDPQSKEDFKSNSLDNKDTCKKKEYSTEWTNASDKSLSTNSQMKIRNYDKHAV